MHNLIPHFISEQFRNNNFRGSFKAYTMFADISGFTKLTETLMKHKKDGAEILTDVINSIFNPIVRTVYDNGGMISSYAGDAFTAIFMIDPESENMDVDHGVMNSANYVNKYFQDNKTVDTMYGMFEMGVKVGLSYGKVDWGIIGRDSKYTYYFKGAAIDGCIKSEHNAAKDEIVLDDGIIGKLQINERHLTVKADGYYRLISQAMIPESKVTRSIAPRFTEKDLKQSEPVTPDSDLFLFQYQPLPV